jgi:trans-2,3-dihydro-3-hydroxyanthranilate isomerase
VPADQVTVRVVRVFVRDGDGGNLLGIHEGLMEDEVMAGIAADLGFSETIYLDTSTDGGAIPVRIFTPQTELPFAGHPLVGATWHVAAPGATTRLSCGIGVVEGRRIDEAHAAIDVSYLPHVERVDPPDGVTEAWIARMPLPYEVYRCATPDDVASYQTPDRPDHRLVWSPGEAGRDDVVRARFFAAGAGVDEDPATGSAAVALAAVLRTEGTSTGELTIHQGAEIGAPSRIGLSWSGTLTTIGGAVVDDGNVTVSVRHGS